jgi:hypothetical protein
MDDKVPLEGEQVALLRRYRRLWIARGDFDEASATIQQIIGFDLRRPPKGESNPLLVMLTVALVISYARPFVNSRGEASIADRTVPGSLLRVLNSADRGLHHHLLRMRNQEIAHSDAEMLELSLKLVVGGDIGIERLPRNPLYRAELYQLRRMISRLIGEIDRLCDSLRQNLPLGVWF